MNHDKDCAWELADCEYKETHHYCPHPEHACTCPPKEISLEDQVAVLRLKLIGSEAINVHLTAEVSELRALYVAAKDLSDAAAMGPETFHPSLTDNINALDEALRSVSGSQPNDHYSGPKQPKSDDSDHYGDLSTAPRRLEEK